MIINKITIDNLLSVGHIELDLTNRGIVLLEGVNESNPALKSNGSGKSTILGSVYYAIYGTFPNGVGADNVINNKVGKGAKAELVFTKGEDTYKVVRARKKNAVTLEKNGVDITTNSAKETDALIQSIFGISSKLFTNAILFDGINSKRFATLGDKDRKEMLVELLNLEVYTEAHALAKADLKDTEVKIVENNRDIQNNGQRKLTLDQQVEREKQEALNKSQYLQTAKSAYDASVKALADFHEAYTDTGHYDSLKVGLAKAEEAVASYTAPVDNTSTLYQSYMSYKTEYDNAERKIQEVSREFQTLTTQKAQYEQSDTCPTCGNEMDAEHKKLEVDKILQRVEVLTQEVAKAQQSMVVNQPKIALALQDYEEARAIIANATGEYQKLVNHASTQRQAVSQLDRQLSTLEAQEHKAKATIDAYTEVHISSTYEDQYASIQEEKAQLEAKSLELATIKHECEVAIKTYSDSGVKSHVMDLTAPFLNTKISEYMNVLSGGTIRVTLSTQKELTNGTKSDKIDLIVSNDFGADSYESLSAGEKRRVDIAISLALQDLVMSKSDLNINIQLFDEVFENLDEVGSENVATLLKARTEISSTIFVVSHNENLKPLFNNVIKVVKRDGLSTLDQGGITT